MDRVHRAIRDGGTVTVWGARFKHTEMLPCASAAAATATTASIRRAVLIMRSGD